MYKRQEKRVFETKGDANETKDREEVKYEDVKGVAKIKIPKAGHMTTLFGSRAGKGALILFLLLLLITETGSRVKKEKQGDAKVVGTGQTPENISPREKRR